MDDILPKKWTLGIKVFCGQRCTIIESRLRYSTVNKKRHIKNKHTISFIFIMNVIIVQISYFFYSKQSKQFQTFSILKRKGSGVRERNVEQVTRSICKNFFF